MLWFNRLNIHFRAKYAELGENEFIRQKYAIVSEKNMDTKIENETMKLNVSIFLLKTQNINADIVGSAYMRITIRTL